jgi:tetratricopeptide (TPR) repeat protein
VLYDRGDYDAAERIYRSLQRVDADNPNLLYNRANCAYMLGDSTVAIALYERARRLAPRDSDILENLNFVRDRLGLPPAGRVQSPLELLVSLRDHLRPDEWLVAGVWAVLVCGIAAGLRRWRRRSQLIPLILAAAVGATVAAAWYTQAQTTYRPGGQGVIASNQATAYQIPSDDAKKTDFVLRAGELVRVEEARTDWLRVRLDGAEGWVRRTSVHPVW